MTDSTPQVSSRHMQTFLEVVDRLEAADCAAIRAAIPGAMLQAIHDHTSASWLPIEVNLEVTRIVAERLGPERAHNFFCDLLLAGFETPLLGSFAKGALRLAGTNPGFALKWVPKGFSLVFRNTGEWSTSDITATTGRLAVDGLPTIMASERLWLDSVASSLQALFKLTNKGGEIRVAEVDVSGGRATFRANWPA